MANLVYDQATGFWKDPSTGKMFLTQDGQQVMGGQGGGGIPWGAAETGGRQMLNSISQPQGNVTGMPSATGTGGVPVGNDLPGSGGFTGDMGSMGSFTGGGGDSSGGGGIASVASDVTGSFKKKDKKPEKSAAEKSEEERLKWKKQYADAVMYPYGDMNEKDMMKYGWAQQLPMPFANPVMAPLAFKAMGEDVSYTPQEAIKFAFLKRSALPSSRMLQEERINKQVTNREEIKNRMMNAVSGVTLLSSLSNLGKASLA